MLAKILKSNILWSCVVVGAVVVAHQVFSVPVETIYGTALLAAGWLGKVGLEKWGYRIKKGVAIHRVAEATGVKPDQASKVVDRILKHGVAQKPKASKRDRNK